MADRSIVFSSTYISTNANQELEPIVTDQTPHSDLSESASPIAGGSGSVAPAWHTVVLIFAIALLSVEGAREFSGSSVNAIESNKLLTYATTVGSELLMLGWVYLGMRLRKIPFRSLFGDLSGGIKSLFLDMGIAITFWMGSLVVLGCIGLTWTATELALKHQSLIAADGKPAAVSDPAQQHLLHTLSALAPSNGREIAAWALVCAMAGLIEELVFRGYFQRQFSAWSRGAIAGGVAFSSLLFGAAHGYQGIRNMVLLSVFGTLFSLLAVFRRNLRAGIFAHAWHDYAVGLLLAFAKSRHLF
jgi:membrane protease YdiL (CAAX protease family)